MVGALEVSVHLGAQEAAGERVVGISGDPRRATLLNRHERGAGIGAVVWARATHDAGIALSESGSGHGRSRKGHVGGRRRKAIVCSRVGLRCLMGLLIRLNV